MKNITKSLLIVLISVICFQGNAQEISLKGGLNLANQLIKYQDESADSDMKLGFHLGASYNFEINDMISFEPGVLLSTKGNMQSEEEGDDNATVKLNLYYLDVPLLLKGKFELADDLKVYGAFGPYIGMGLSGKLSATVEIGGEKETLSEDVEWGDTDGLERLDYGATFGAGVEFDSIIVGLSYDLGLANLIPHVNYTMKNRVFKVTVGYIL